MQQINEDEGIAAVHEAFRLGINFFDTSPFYGGTRSEQVSSSLGRPCMCQQSKGWCCAAMACERQAGCAACDTVSDSASTLADQCTSSRKAH